MPIINYTGTKREVVDAIRGVANAIAGRAADPTGMVQGLQLRMGTVLLSKIQQAFAEKARGGTGEDGITWPELKPETIARRRLGPEDKKAVRLKARAPALTEAQRRALEKQVRTRQAELTAKFGLAPSQAAGLARAQVESAGRTAKEIRSKRSVLAARSVEILRDSGELYRSFSPGIDGRSSGAEGQVFRVPSGEIIVGTNKKPWHHRGGGNLPERPYWPQDGQLPDSWWDAIKLAGRRGMLEIFVKVLTR